MATLLHSLLHTHQTLCSSISWQPLLLDAPFMYTNSHVNNDVTRSNISHWGGVPQARLLASLANISQNNNGWILIANAPAPLSRHALLNAGVDPARVIDAKQASRQLVLQAITCSSIAVVVCWKYGDLKSNTLDTHKKQRQALATSEWTLGTQCRVFSANQKKNQSLSAYVNSNAYLGR